MNDAIKYLRHKYTTRTDRWYPILSVLYLTYRCDFRCSYCSDGNGTPYYRLGDEELQGRQIVDILGRIRRHADHVVLTGGEPLLHPDLSMVMKSLPSLKFKTTALTTNAYTLEPILPLLPGAIDLLVVSLDTLDPGKADGIYGLGSGRFDQVMRNVELAEERLKGTSTAIAVSSVATPGNIGDLYSVYDYCKKRDWLFAACPQLVGVKAHPALENNPAYREFFDFLIMEKKAGGPIQGTLPYLSTMRDLAKFDCYPFTMLVVSPTGEIFYPCLEIGHPAGNLLEETDLHAMRRAAEKRYGPQPACDTRCHSACALGFAMMIRHPGVFAEEAWWSLRRKWNARRRGKARMNGEGTICNRKDSHAISSG